MPNVYNASIFFFLKMLLEREKEIQNFVNRNAKIKTSELVY